MNGLMTHSGDPACGRKVSGTRPDALEEMIVAIRGCCKLIYLYERDSDSL